MAKGRRQPLAVGLARGYRGPMTPGEQVRALYEAYQDRDWARAATFLHPQVVVEMPATAERLEGQDAVIGFQRSYPEPWGVLAVRRVLADPEGAAAEVSVVDPEGRRFALAVFWGCRDGLLSEGVEYWITVGNEPPPIRASSPATHAARRAWDRQEVLGMVSDALTDGGWHPLPDLAREFRLDLGRVGEVVTELVNSGVAYQGPEGKSRNEVQLRVLADRRVLPILQMLSGDMSNPWREVGPVAGLTLKEALETVEALERTGALLVDRSDQEHLLFRRGAEDEDSPIGSPRGSSGRLP